LDSLLVDATVFCFFLIGGFLEWFCIVQQGVSSADVALQWQIWWGR